jgi:hypothetical protein
MLARCFEAIIDFCIRHAPLIIIVTAILGFGSAVYVERHFAVSNVNKLVSPNLPWGKRDAAYAAAFPQQASSIFAVVTAPTSEFANTAAAALADQAYAAKAPIRAAHISPANRCISRRRTLGADEHIEPSGATVANGVERSLAPQTLARPVAGARRPTDWTVYLDQIAQPLEHHCGPDRACSGR